MTSANGVFETENSQYLQQHKHYPEGQIVGVLANHREEHVVDYLEPHYTQDQVVDYHFSQRPMGLKVFDKHKHHVVFLYMVPEGEEEEP